jgi:hypothetical protein
MSAMLDTNCSSLWDIAAHSGQNREQKFQKYRFFGDLLNFSGLFWTFPGFCQDFSWIFSGLSWTFFLENVFVIFRNFLDFLLSIQPTRLCSSSSITTTMMI